MAYANYEVDGIPHVGEVSGDSLIPLEGLSHIGRDTPADLLVSARRLPEAAVQRTAVRLLPASPEARKIVCIGLNYKAHIEETLRDVPQYPVMFPKYASNLIADGDNILLPPESSQADYEGELAVIIGKAGRRIPEEQALEHVLGYSVANDVTMRDYQYKTHQWLQGKAWDSSTPLGPYIVTPEEVDLHQARIQTTVNGQVVQDSDLSHLIFSIPRLIATVSEFTQLEPGDVILTGTPAGIGYRRDPQLFLAHGDVVSVSVAGVGTITNRAVSEDMAG